MVVARDSCLAAVLPDNQLMVVGGWINGNNSIELILVAYL